jgi:hypothetical protein
VAVLFIYCALFFGVRGEPFSWVFGHLLEPTHSVTLPRSVFKSYATVAMPARLVVCIWWLLVLYLGVWLFAPKPSVPAETITVATHLEPQSPPSLDGSDAELVERSSIRTRSMMKRAAITKSRHTRVLVSSASAPELPLLKAQTRPRSASTEARRRNFGVILVRKYYHGLAVLMFMPAILLEVSSHQVFSRC